MDMAPAEAPQRTTLSLNWIHPLGLYALSFVNFALKIVTLGIYNFWAKTEVRKKLWSGVRLNGEPLVYTGTGKELFLGFLIVFGAIVFPVMLLSFGAVVAFGPGSAGYYLYTAGLYAFIFLLTGIGIYRAQRYRLSRTRWRGIRASLVGSDTSYAWTYFWTGLLIPLTLGAILPWRATKLQSILVSDMRFGNRPFYFDAKAAPLYGRFAVFWLVGALALMAIFVSFGAFGALVTLTRDVGDTGQSTTALAGFIAVALGALILLSLVYLVTSAWYRAFQFNHFAAHTRFEGARLKGTQTAGGLIWIGVTNLLIVVLTLGILSPVAQARSARYLIENLDIEGHVPLAEIAQGAEQDIARGEGLAQAFDIDGF